MRAPAQAPLLDLTGQHSAIRRELTEAFERVLASSQFILGPEVEAFEREIAAHAGCAYAIAMSSGSDALLAALMALGIGPGDEVITTAYSFFATAGCVARLGATPVFVDVEADTMNIDPVAVSAHVTQRTRAIIPVHLFGLPANMDPLLAIAERHRLMIVEDACQAIGASYKGRPAGSLGQMAAFSFFPSKNLGALGDGGLLTTNDPEMHTRVRMLRAHGSRRKYHHEIVGGNFRLDALQCAFLRVKLTYLTEWNEQRRHHAALYDRLFEHGGLDAVVLPARPEHSVQVFHQYVVRTPRRDALRAHLASRGIGTEVYYPTPLHLQPCFDALGYQPGSLPKAEKSCAEALALPIYPELTDQQQQGVVAAIEEFFNTEPSR